MKTAKPQYVVTLQAVPGDSRPPEIRMRRALKLLLRCCGLRCTAISTTPAVITGSSNTEGNSNESR